MAQGDSAGFLAAARAELPPEIVVEDPERVAPFLVEMRGLMCGNSPVLLRPGSTEEVAQAMRLAARFGVPVVPMGGNTGLVGGGVPFGAVVLSLGRMNRVRSLDPTGGTMTLEAGVVLAEAQRVAREAGFLFPLSLASEGSCTIGGNIASNAGGTAVLRYGNTRDLVLGLEVVLADGRVMNLLSALRKDNAGYDLKHLFIGSEGTLGVVTAAVLKLFPLPQARATAFVGATDPHRIVALFERLRRAAGERLTTFEFLPRFGLDIVLRHGTNARDPLAGPHAWYALAEFTSPDPSAPLDDSLAAALEGALEAGEIEDAALAASDAQADDFWRLRELLATCQGHEGGSIKHDVSVPIGQVADFVIATGAACEAAMPGLRVCAFGHIGDGNVHFNLSQPIGMDKTAFLGQWHRFNELVHDAVAARGGSIAAEHGVGLFKRDELVRYQDPVALDLMGVIKRALDPENRLNPGKVVRIGGDLPAFEPGR